MSPEPYAGKNSTERSEGTLMLKWLASLINGVARNHGVGSTPNTPSTPTTSEPTPKSSADQSSGPAELRPAVNIPALKRQIRLHEGERLKVYKCTAGKLTIGVGRNLEDRGITPEESSYLLENDLRTFQVELLRKLPWVADLDDVRQRVLIDMAFNLGIAGLLTFKNTLAAIKRGDYEKGARGMLDSKWASQVGKRAERLSTMMLTGKDPRELWPKP